MTALVWFTHPSGRPLRALLADDNHDSADSLSLLLKLVGCEVRVGYDRGAVLPLAVRFRPDVCILDVRMPVLDGWTVASRLRGWAGDRMLLLIAYTGLGGRQAEEHSLNAGFDHHVLKPGDPEVLFEDFAKFIERTDHRLKKTRIPHGQPSPLDAAGGGAGGAFRRSRNTVPRNAWHWNRHPGAPRPVFPLTIDGDLEPCRGTHSKQSS